MELSQFKSLEPQLSDDSPLENFVRLTEDPGGTQHQLGSQESHENPWKNVWKGQEKMVGFWIQKTALFL